MEKQALLYGVVGLLAGSLLTLFVSATAVNNNMSGMMRMMGMHPQGSQLEEGCPVGGDEHHEVGMDSSMDEMMESMTGKTGDEFDKAFLDAMTVHHQGAIQMAEEAKRSSKHMELQSMSDDIINAQQNEVQMMQGWKKQWGY
ncbi:MAG TPA: DUF305 domain-containing protein [Patescibacteria group bacterium]|nr:DUF305 domain-containing protein [Patescibacteria group bacterium]